MALGWCCSFLTSLEMRWMRAHLRATTAPPMNMLGRGMESVDKYKAKRKRCNYSSLMEHPPPVPVTHPKVQNLAHSEGMRLAGCSGSEDVMS